MTMTVHRIARVWFLCATVLGSAAQASEIIQGRVLQAGNAQLSIRTVDGRPRVFSVRAGAIVTLNGMRTRLEDLRPGYPLTVTTSVGHVADRIDAKSFGLNPGHHGSRVRRAGNRCKGAAAFSRSRCSN